VQCFRLQDLAAPDIDNFEKLYFINCYCGEASNRDRASLLSETQDFGGMQISSVDKDMP
jgi:hypothetical protein